MSDSGSGDMSDCGNGDPVLSDFASDPDFSELLQFFVQSIPEKQESLKATYEAGELDDLAHQAHQLKGAGGGYGFPELSQLAAELEAACRDGDGDVAQRLDGVLDFLGRVTA